MIVTEAHMTKTISLHDATILNCECGARYIALMGRKYRHPNPQNEEDVRKERYKEACPYATTDEVTLSDILARKGVNVPVTLAV
jgi:hypothetical protein